VGAVSSHLQPRNGVRCVHHAAVAITLLASIGSLAACGGSYGKSPSQSAAPTAAPIPASGGGALPAVTGASDLTHEPGIDPGGPHPPTSLLTKDLMVGNGPLATPSSTVSVQYVGANYADGKDFDASWTDGGQPAQFSLAGGVIPGFAQGIAGMKIGGRREIVIPPALGYGDQAQGPIVANENLVFVVDLKNVS
jgi:hypothetical protein